MATVNGITVEGLNAILADMVIGLRVDNEGKVLAQKRDGDEDYVTTIATAKNVLDLAYPIGSIFMSIDAANPATKFGVGTWTAWGSGRVPVGVNTSDPDFPPNVIGGSKGTKLTAANIPAHSHRISDLKIYATGGASNTSENNGRSFTQGGPSNRFEHQVDVFDGVTSVVGVDDPAAVSSLQPYITCYMWRRTG